MVLYFYFQNQKFEDFYEKAPSLRSSFSSSSSLSSISSSDAETKAAYDQPGTVVLNPLNYQHEEHVQKAPLLARECPVKWKTKSFQVPRKRRIPVWGVRDPSFLVLKMKFQKSKDQLVNWKSDKTATFSQNNDAFWCTRKNQKPKSWPRQHKNTFNAAPLAN